MKKKLIGILTAIMTFCLTFCCTACGEGAGEGGGSVASRTDKYGNTLVTIMVHKDSSTKEGRAYQKCIDDFNEHYKEQKIKAQITFVAQTAGVDQYETTLWNKLAQGGGALYDIISFDAPNCARFAAENLLYDITNLLDGYEKDFIPASINKYNNSIYGLPIQESSAGFYYNKAILNGAGVSDGEIADYQRNGWTFDQFKSVCQRIKGSGKTAVDMQLTAGGETSTYLLYPLGNAAGGEYLSPDGLTAKGYLNSAETKAGFQFIKDCVAEGYTSYQIGSTDFLAKGTVGMYLSSGWTIPDINEQYSATFTGGWGILPYPHASGSAAVSATGSWSFGLTDNGIEDKSAAILLLKWMTSDDSARVITNATGMIPAKNTIQTSFAELSPQWVLYNQLVTTGKSRPTTVGYGDFSTEFNLILTALRNDSVAAALDNHATSLQTKLDRI
ncbi:MAG: extracellular solute-binding protein [Clostridia bacterium]|nr:extracellular solute-binding protein [Clostridia bacterium]